jgi:FdhD protein
MLVGRARGKRFVALSGADRIIHDLDPAETEDEPATHRRKGSVDDD